MTRGISLHIGLNAIDPNHYGTTGVLEGCENDARSMEAIARSRGFQPTTLLTQQATSKNVIAQIRAAAATLHDGDIFFLTCSSHGSQVPDTNGDEEDGMDEAWCLYDRMLVDDELYELWSSFAAGVRVCMVSDTCHSGTVARVLAMSPANGAANDSGIDASFPWGTPRLLPADVAEDTIRRNRALYQRIQRRSRAVGTPACGVILLAACQDHQTAGDGPANGAFTAALLRTWNNAAYRDGYVAFIKSIGVTLLPWGQTPNLDRVGRVSAAFEQQIPFTIDVTRTTVSRGGTTMPNGTISDPHISHSGVDFLSIDDRLNRIKAIVGARELPAGDGDRTEINDGPRFQFDLTIPRSTIGNKPDADVYQYLRTTACDELMRTYLRLSSIPMPRDFEGHAECHVDSHGGFGCSAGGSIRF